VPKSDDLEEKKLVQGKKEIVRFVAPFGAEMFRERFKGERRAPH